MYNQSIGNAFELLELLSLEPNGLKMTEIGRRLNLNKSTTYRLLAEMKERGYVHQNKERGAYQIGIKFIGFVSSYLNNVELKTEAHSMMRQLNENIDRTVYLAIQQEDEVVYIDRVTKFNSIRQYSIIGQRKPMHCTSLGKSLLFATPDDEILGILERQGMEEFTDKTIRTPEQFLKEIQLCRQRGWSLDDEEIEDGVKCISAPVFDYRNKVIAAISASWYIECDLNITEKNLGQQIVKVANEVSVRMGCVIGTDTRKSNFDGFASPVFRPKPVLVN